MENQTNINGIVFLRSYYEAVEELEGNDKLEMYEAIFNLVFNGIEPNFTKKYLNGYFKLIQPTLMSSITRYKNSVENGKKGGRKPSIKIEETLAQPKQETVEAKQEVIQLKETVQSKQPVLTSGYDEDDEEIQVEEFEKYDMNDSSIPTDFLFDYYKTLTFSSQVKRAMIYTEIEEGKIMTKQEILEATF
jgi:hypothetical protein